MKTEDILTLLIAERDKLSKAIEALSGTTLKPVSIPKSVEPSAAAAPASAEALPKTARNPLTADQKKAHSERMKSFWAARRKKPAKS